MEDVTLHRREKRKGSRELIKGQRGKVVISCLENEKISYFYRIWGSNSGPLNTGATSNHSVNLDSYEDSAQNNIYTNFAYVKFCRGYDMIRKNLLNPISNGSFHPIIDEFPVIGSLLQQLLLTVDKVDSSRTASQRLIIDGSYIEHSV